MTVKCTAQDKFKELLREIKQRQHVYPRLIDAGKLTKQKADQQLAVIEAIAEDYRDAADREARAERLI